MESDPSVGVRIFACLVAAVFLGGAVTGAVAGAASGGSVTGAVAGAASGGSVVTASTDSLETTDDGTTNSTENTSEELESTTESLETNTENTTDDTENTTDGLENTTTDPADAIENTTTETTETVTDTVSNTTETVNNTTTIANETVTNTTATVNETVSEATGAINETVGETAETTNGTVAGIGGRLEQAIGGAAAPVDPPSTSEAATNAILVGMLGAISASGVAAGGAGGAGASGAAGGASTATASWLRHLRETDRLRRAAADLWKALPIFRYSRYDDSDPLEHDCRAAIYETVRKQPGAYLSEVSDRTEVPLSTVRHHVRILEDEGLVTARKVNGKRRYFLEGDDAELLAALAEPAKREVLETIAEFGRAPNGRLADALERDPSTVSHHLAALEDDGLVVREKDGRSMVNELPPRVEAALADERAAETDSRAIPADD
ncbi:helix-turn-helix domain-containing protein [Natrinema sp. DC36]|uniref:winged helix-turn-helix transcriptional regulator n=1 Tax=Natrinema sp. DC36 TaxID=2878680 RepID=UPI001CEFBB4F|nr:helix-turn-helix domain-containing protein [Natrinema sp. DC36]